MKTILVVISLALVGCLKPIPPEPPKPEVVVIQKIPVVKGELLGLIEIIPDPEPPVHTWMTGDEIPKQDAGPEVDECGCIIGDPLCGCINGVKLEITP